MMFWFWGLMTQFLWTIKKYCLHCTRLKLKKDKNQVTSGRKKYLCFGTSQKGRAPLPEKVPAMQMASTLKNITELKAFLRPLNGHYLPHSTASIGSLHHLLEEKNLGYGVQRWENGTPRTSVLNRLLSKPH